MDKTLLERRNVQRRTIVEAFSYKTHTQTSVYMQDKSWRVRYNVAQQLYQLCEALGPELAR